MAVGFDAGGTTADVGSGLTISNSSLTVGSGANRLLVAFFGINHCAADGLLDAISLTIAWDPAGANQAMTAIPNAVNGSAAAGIGLCLYGLIAPVSGNKTCTATWTTDNVYEAHLNVASFTGVDQTSVAVACPHGAGNFLTTASISAPVTSAIGNMAVACMGQHQNFWSAVTPTGIDLDGTAGSFALASIYGAGAATVTFTGAWGGSAGDASTWAGCDILAAAAGGPPPSTLASIAASRKMFLPPKKNFRIQ